MKRIASLFLCISLFCGLGLTAYAADNIDPVIIVEPTGGSTADTTAQPIEVKMEMVGDVPYITKTYEADTLAVLDIPATFDQDGYRFTRCDSFSRGTPDEVESRTESRTVTLEVAEDDRAAALALAEPFLDYAEDGFTGRLKLDENAISITEAGREGTSTRVTEVKEYQNLDRQDAAYLAKTITKNGVSLALEDVEWTVMGTTPTGDGPVANLFKAMATYGGTVSGSRVTGYTATLRYTGTVSKSTPGNALTSVVYRGERIEAPVVESRSLLGPILVCVLVSMAILAAGAVIFVIHGRRSRRPAPTREIDVEGVRLAAEAGYDAGLAATHSAALLDSTEENDEMEDDDETEAYEADEGYWQDEDEDE